MLGKGLIAATQDELVAVPHSVDFAAIDFDSFDAVLNMTHPPAYRREPYREEHDTDLVIARTIVAQNARRSRLYLMSSRKVYGDHGGKPVREDAELRPTDHYGVNKAATERAVAELLGERCSIFRIGNVFDYELGRASFFGIALARLKTHDEIVLDCSPFTGRDFIPLADCARAILSLVERCASGIVNIGSGQSIPVGQIALWIIEGFGRGRLVVDSPAEKDAFALDIRRLVDEIGPPSCDVRVRCREIGERLAWTAS
jgi:dTDP-4-dehydrorhamnose reductase/UDP-glucose 4-epimerase